MDVVAKDGFLRSKIDPRKFALFVGCASIVMMFAGLTSAYIVRQAAGNWLEFRLPDLFYVSTGVLLLSSLTLHSSYLSFKKGKEKPYKLLLLASFVLGFVFIALQYMGWQKLTEIGVSLTTNPSGSFVYVISGLHVAHVLGGIAALVIALLHAYSLKFEVNKKRKLRFELTLIYWHFVDLLWVYLLIFLTTQQV